MKTVSINNKSYLVAPVVANFEIHAPKSSTVAFFGVDREYQMLFVQFIGSANRAGGAYLYTQVPADVLDRMVAAPSVGVYFAAEIRGKYASVKSADVLVREG